MVSTPHVLATEAALDILQAGGSAVDAAIAANAVLMVVMPDQCGLGGDLFAVVYDPRLKGKVFGINGSGGAPRAATIDEFARRGKQTMPQQGPLSLTVPGAVHAWGELGRRWGLLSLKEQLYAAVELAAHGFGITSFLSQSINASRNMLSKNSVAIADFADNGTLLSTGQQLIQTKLAQVLRLIGEQGTQAFYERGIASEITKAVQAEGGLLAESDLRDHQSEWVEPIQSQYRGYQVYTLQPNSPGMLLLLILNQLDRHDIAQMGYQSPVYVQLSVDAVRRAFAFGGPMVADPRVVTTGWREAISKATSFPTELNSSNGINLSGDTISICVVDNQGLGVSLIQSIYHDFGSGVYIDSLGFFLQNRGASFELNPEHPNNLAPRKRPAHTLTPTIVCDEADLDMLLAVRGGDGQTQTQTQILSGVLDFGLDIQAAVESPRWIWGGTTSMRRSNGLVVEDSFPQDTIEALIQAGIPVEKTPALSVAWMGCAQGIQVDRERGVLYGGADPRGGGLAKGY